MLVEIRDPDKIQCILAMVVSLSIAGMIMQTDCSGWCSGIIKLTVCLCMCGLSFGTQLIGN